MCAETFTHDGDNGKAHEKPQEDADTNHVLHEALCNLGAENRDQVECQRMHTACHRISGVDHMASILGALRRQAATDVNKGDVEEGGETVDELKDKELGNETVLVSLAPTQPCSQPSTTIVKRLPAIQFYCLGLALDLPKANSTRRTRTIESPTHRVRPVVLCVRERTRKILVEGVEPDDHNRVDDGS